MRNRRIMNSYFTDDGATANPAIENDTVSGLYSHLHGGHWSTVIAHAGLHMFGVPDGMRVVPLKSPAHGPRVGLVIAARSPEPVLARALLDVARQAGVHKALDDLLDVHLMGSGYLDIAKVLWDHIPTIDWYPGCARADGGPGYAGDIWYPQPAPADPGVSGIT